MIIMKPDLAILLLELLIMWNDKAKIAMQLLVISMETAIHSITILKLFNLLATPLYMIIETLYFIIKTTNTTRSPSFDNLAGEAMIPAFIE